MSRDKDRMRSLCPLQCGNCIDTNAIGRWLNPFPPLNAMVPAEWWLFTRSNHGCAILCKADKLMPSDNASPGQPACPDLTQRRTTKCVVSNHRHPPWPLPNPSAYLFQAVTNRVDVLSPVHYCVACRLWKTGDGKDHRAVLHLFHPRDRGGPHGLHALMRTQWPRGWCVFCASDCPRQMHGAPPVKLASCSALSPAPASAALGIFLLTQEAIRGFLPPCCAGNNDSVNAAIPGFPFLKG